MGNQVGVCREPPQLSELFSQQKDTTQATRLLQDRQTIQEDGFRSYLQLWRFYSDSGDDVVIKNSPVRFAQFKKFESKDCYIALHVIKNIAPENRTTSSPRSLDSPRSNPHNTSLCELLASSMDELTPRGTTCSFGTLSLEPFIHNTTGDYSHDLYVWNGKNSSSLAKAVALAKGFEIERILMQDKLTGTLFQLLAKSPKAALSAHFVDDLASFKQDSRQFDIRKYENNHIFRQLVVGANKRPVSTVKIGELFGPPTEGPRYEVLKKLVHSQPNGLAVSKAADLPTKPPIRVPLISKIPPLSFTPNPSATPASALKDPPYTSPPAKLTSAPQTHTPLPHATAVSSAPSNILTMPAATPTHTVLQIPTPTPSPMPTPASTSTPTLPVMALPLPVPTPIVPPIPTPIPSSTTMPTPGPIIKVPSLKLASSSEPKPVLPLKVPSLPNIPLGQLTTPREAVNYSAMSPRELRARFEPELSRILDYLYLGGQKPAMDRPALQRAGITHVLNCAGGACRDYFPDEFVYKTYDIGDGLSEDITCLFYESLEFIEDAVKSNGKVLIHCHQGISRSSAFVICYLMWKNNWEFGQAHEFTKVGRFIASPNPGFIHQLLCWRKLLDEEKLSRETRMLRITRHSKNTLLVPKRVAILSSAALDPRGCFIVQTPSMFYYWIGEQCPTPFVDAARRIISSIQKYEGAQGDEVVEVHQGREPNDFWEHIGRCGPISEVADYADYQSESTLMNGANNGKPLLFFYNTSLHSWQRSNVKFKEDLSNERIYILQAPPCIIYVWVGENAEWENTTDRPNIGEAAAENFVQSHLAHQQDPPVVVLIDPSNEDRDFNAYFSV
jgi:hypothetical protein